MILVFLLTESCEIKYTINKWIWRNNMFKKGKRLAALCTIIFVVLSMCMPCLADETQKTIRVGSFEDTFNYVDEHGVKRGYGYELMQALAGYTGWKFEYVKCDWSNCFDKLENGEIDIMGDIAYTDDRAKEMLFSEETMGEEKYVLYADLTNTDILSSDYKSLNGKRIGVVKGAKPEYMLTEWENKHGIHTEHVNVGNNEDVKKKLANDEIDCFVSLEESIWSERGISSVTTIGKSDIYFVINKERSDIKQELDYAMRQLDSDSPFFKDDLYKKYFALNYMQFLTGNEESWLEEHGGIRIGFLDNDPVVFSMDKKSGEIHGTLSEYISYAKDCLGNHTLKFDIEAFDDYDKMIEALQNNEIDVIYYASRNSNVAEKKGYALSNTAWTYNLIAVTNKEDFNENDAYVVAVPKNKVALKQHIAYNYPHWKLVDCDSNDEIGQLKAQINDLYETLLDSISNLELKNKEILRLEKIKYDFFKGASHELKTPLASLKIILENMKYNVGKYKNRDLYIDDCIDLVDHLTKSIQQILSVYSIENLKDDEEIVCIKNELSRVLQKYDVLIHQKELRIQNDVKDETMYIGKTALNIILSNLISNAINYTYEKGMIQIGIEQDYFYIQNKQDPTQPKGNGLGLYIVRNLLDNYKMKYEVIEGVDFIFKIRFKH